MFFFWTSNKASFTLKHEPWTSYTLLYLVMTLGEEKLHYLDIINTIVLSYRIIMGDRKHYPVNLSATLYFIMRITG